MALGCRDTLCRFLVLDGRISELQKRVVKPIRNLTFGALFTIFWGDDLFLSLPHQIESCSSHYPYYSYFFGLYLPKSKATTKQTKKTHSFLPTSSTGLSLVEIASHHPTLGLSGSKLPWKAWTCCAQGKFPSQASL